MSYGSHFPTFFIHIPIFPCSGEDFDDQVVVVGDGQDAGLGFIKHCVYVFTQDNRDGNYDTTIADCELHWVGFLIDKVIHCERQKFGCIRCQIKNLYIR